MKTLSGPAAFPVRAHPEAQGSQIRQSQHPRRGRLPPLGESPCGPRSRFGPGTQATHSSQRGAVLVTALIFLVILTLLGTSGVMNNVLQERMAGNARNRDLAFQSAEHALRLVDNWMMTGNGGGKQNATTLATAVGAPTTPLANDAESWRTFNWSSDSRLRTPDPAHDLDNVAGQANYVIERLPAYTDPAGAAHDVYRVTARGIGGVDDSAAVILQALYRL